MQYAYELSKNYLIRYHNIFINKLYIINFPLYEKIFKLIILFFTLNNIIIIIKKKFLFFNVIFILINIIFFLNLVRSINILIIMQYYYFSYTFVRTCLVKIIYISKNSILNFLFDITLVTLYIY